MIGCTVEKLEKALTFRTIEVNGELLTTPLSKERALFARDALAKAMYERMFNWLVERINKSLQSEDDESRKVLMGILDIYGFEVFNTNR